MTKTTLKIEGMMCSMCEAHVNEKLKEAFPEINKVTSSHSKGITIIISDQEYTEEELHAVLDHTGYQLVSVETEPYEKKGFSLFGRK